MHDYHDTFFSRKLNWKNARILYFNRRACCTKRCATVYALLTQLIRNDFCSSLARSAGGMPPSLEHAERLQAEEFAAVLSGDLAPAAALLMRAGVAYFQRDSSRGARK